MNQKNVAKIVDRLSWTVGAISNLRAVISTAPFWQYEGGTTIRPMGWAMQIFQIGAESIIIMSILAIYPAVQKRWKHAGNLILLGILPYPLGGVIAGLTSAYRQLEWAH